MNRHLMSFWFEIRLCFVVLLMVIGLIGLSISWAGFMSDSRALMILLYPIMFVFTQFGYAVMEDEENRKKEWIKLKGVAND